jgi:hypothetical protein
MLGLKLGAGYCQATSSDLGAISRRPRAQSLERQVSHHDSPDDNIAAHVIQTTPVTTTNLPKAADGRMGKRAGC